MTLRGIAPSSGGGGGTPGGAANTVQYNNAGAFGGIALTDGQLLIGSTGNAPSAASLTAGSNITITPAAGGITIAASGGANSGPTFPGGIPLTGVSYPRIAGNALATGNNDLHTVPSGKRLLITGVTALNGGAGNIPFYLATKIAGTYYRLGTSITPTPGAASVNVTTMAGYIAEPGETIAAVTATNNGLNIAVRGVQFDNTSTVFSAKLLSLSNGANTVYTCPGGKTAAILDFQASFSIANQAVHYVNSSGGSLNVSWNLVPSGGAVGAGNLMVPSVAVNDATRTSSSATYSLDPGDFININTSANTATQMAWVNVMEI